MRGFQTGENGDWELFGAICDTSAIPNRRAAHFIKLMLPVPTDRFCCHQQDHGFPASWVACAAASSKGWRAVTLLLSGHRCAQAVIRFALGAVVASGPTFAARLRGLKSMFVITAAFRLLAAARQQCASKLAGQTATIFSSESPFVQKS